MHPRADRSPVASQLAGISNSIAAMVFWGFALRVVGILLLGTYRVRAFDKLNGFQNFSFGFETGRIAASIANGFGFANPFDGITGPTSWVAPVYPYLTALAFKLFGTYSQSSAFFLLTLNSLFSALTAIPVYLIARRVYGDRVARWAGWTWTLFPYCMYWAIKWIWETSLSAFLLAVVVWLTLKLEEDARLRTWLWWGFTWGVLALTNPACIAFLPFAAAWVVWRRWRQQLRWFVPALASALVFVAVLLPWEVRNYQVFDKFIFVRGNLGVELRLGNAPNANGMWMWWLHPTQNRFELAKYKSMGEVAYVEQRKQQFLDFVERDPGKFAYLVAAKAVYYWAGVPKTGKFPGHSELRNALFLTSSLLAFFGLLLTIRKRKKGAFLFASLILVYPLVYYLSFPHARYRHPIEPILLILAVYLISETREAQMAESRTLSLPQSSTTVGIEKQQATTLSLIIPCYNEKKTIRRVVDTVVHATTVAPESDLVPLDKEIVIVDDYSSDGTREILAELERDVPALYSHATLKVLYHEVNKGKGAAVRTGIKNATGDIVLVQDADLEYDPKDFPVLLEPILTNRADAVFGNRFHGGAHRVLYFWHYQANRMLTLFCNMLSDLNLSDMEVGYKAFRREIFDHITLKSNRFGFEPEVTIKTAKLRCRIYEVPCSYHGRTYDEGKKIGWKDGVAAIWHMIKYRFFD
ncbi:MAG TPA: glycosyltransferase [Terriglobales bacterium]|nr:glycosyltransferase [Terriglobales bacterium]